MSAETPPPFAELLKEAISGDHDAMEQLVARYEFEIRLVARARLSASLRPYLDTFDVTQSVHRSLLSGLTGGQFDIRSPEHLVALAITITQRKIAKKWRHLKRQVRDSATGSQELPREVISEEIDPAEVVSQHEAMTQMLDRVSPEERDVIELRLQGYSTADAARKLGIDPDVLRVRISRMRRRLAMREQ